MSSIVSLHNKSFGAHERVVFVSDIHLFYEGEDYLARFTNLLDTLLVAPPSALFIHGDLFDFYVGPRQGGKDFYKPLFDRLRDLTQKGCPTCVIHGNRDFLMGRRFADHGVEVIPDAIRITCGGQSVQVSHGDEFCIHDKSYQFWARRVLRAAPIRFLVRNAPVSLAFLAARRYRKISSKKMARYAGTEQSRLGTILDGARQFLEDSPLDVLICGHIHHLAETMLDHPRGKARLLTTGAWEAGPNYIAWEEGTFRLYRFDAQTRTSEPSDPDPSRSLGNA